MDDNDAKFQWRNLWRSIFVFVIDFSILAIIVSGIVGVFYCVLKACNLNISRVFSGKDYVDIISATVWPISLLLILMLFRNPLMRIIYELPGFIRRSRYGQSSFSEEEKRQSIKREKRKENESGNGEGDITKAEKENFGSGYNSDAQRLDCTNPIEIEKEIIGMLKKEYMVTEVAINARIRQSNLIFDGVFWKNDHLYAVEIKKISNFVSVENLLERVAMFVQGLPIKYRENFSFIICLVYEKAINDLRIRLAEVVQRFDFEVIIKYYPLSDIKRA